MHESLAPALLPLEREPSRTDSEEGTVCRGQTCLLHFVIQLKHFGSIGSFAEHHVRPGVFYFSKKAHNERHEVKLRRDEALHYYKQAKVKNYWPYIACLSPCLRQAELMCSRPTCRQNLRIHQSQIALSGASQMCEHCLAHPGRRQGVWD